MELPRTPANYSSPAVANGVVYAGSDRGKVYALKASSGVLLWTYQAPTGIVNSLAVANGVLYFGSGELYALNARTGAKLWSYKTGTGADSPIVANGVVYVGDYNGNIYAFGLQ